MFHYLNAVSLFKSCVCYFFIFVKFSPSDSSSNTMKDVFILSKKHFLFSRYSNFYIVPSFSPCAPKGNGTSSQIFLY